MSAIGNKAESLLRLRDEFGVDVPEFVVIPFDDVITDFDTVQRSLETAITAFFRRGSMASLETRVAQVLEAVHLHEPALERWHATIEARAWSRISFRTSAALEDSTGQSFAGQYESFLDVRYDIGALRDHIHACFGSIVSTRVLSYAHTVGVTEFVVGGSVIVQEMFYGTQSGVLFSENGTGSLAIALTDGWRNTVVEGDEATEIAVPRHDVDGAAVSEPLRRLCRRAMALDQAVGRPVDVEWATDGDRVVFLQFRPVTAATLDSIMEWDSTNITENYPGITLPLTYSVIRELYAGVYPSFLRLLGTSEKDLRDGAVVFDNMLGYLDGRVYYRISNWYEVLRFLPGRRNQEFFEAMLNPVTIRGAAGRQRTRLDVRSLRAMTRFLWLLATSERRSERFRRRFATQLAHFESYHVDFVNASVLLDESQRIRVQMLSDWAVPILNDVRLMVFHGLLKKLFGENVDHADYLAFLQGLTDRASLKPLEMLSELGRFVRDAMERTGALTVDALRDSPSWPEVTVRANAYIHEFGARTPGELKLETIRIGDDLSTVLDLALKAADAPTSPRTAAVIQWPASIPAARRPLVRWVANHTRRAIDWRERFRFNRAQTFNLTRSVFDAIGRILASEGLLAEPRDVYWLTEREVGDIVNGHAWSLDARDTVSARQRQFAEYDAATMSLAMRGSGPIAARHLVPVTTRGAGTELAGNGVAPGVLRAEVIVATEFDSSLDVRGKILVVHHIDPGWTLLFTQAAGIVAERGNALSHAAIVAREIGIPAIVAAEGATTQLSTGDVITINGTTGAIDRDANQ